LTDVQNSYTSMPVVSLEYTTIIPKSRQHLTTEFFLKLTRFHTVV